MVAALTDILSNHAITAAAAAKGTIGALLHALENYFGTSFSNQNELKYERPSSKIYFFYEARGSTR